MYKLISVDNEETVGNIEVGKIGNIEYDGIRLYFRSVRTSTVRSITVNGDTTTVQTRNTKYTFEKENN